MNKLEEYRDKEVAKVEKYYKEELPTWDVPAATYQQGFDAAIALDLPVKFNKWLETATGEEMIEAYKIMGKDVNNMASIEELYRYWIDNVYKPE